jgi:type VI protein secretion system component VasF
MTLLELTEPLLQYVCRLNRVARKSGVVPTGDTVFLSAKSPAVPRGVSLDYHVVRNEIKAILEEAQHKAAKDFRLASQVKKVELPLIFFIDSFISESSLRFAAQWNQNRLAYERNELAGDEKFFDLLEEDLKDNSDEASERLAVFYTCLGLGFTGIYFKQPEYLKNKMFAIAPRIRRWLDVDEAARICPDAYEGVDVRDLTEPPSRQVFVISLVLLSLILAVLVSCIWLYHSSKRELIGSLDEIIQHDPGAATKK